MEKEHWQMTRGEYLFATIQSNPRPRTKAMRALERRYTDWHRRVVGQAMFEHKPVPAIVLADYPGMKTYVDSFR